MRFGVLHVTDSGGCEEKDFVKVTRTEQNGLRQQQGNYCRFIPDCAAPDWGFGPIKIFISLESLAWFQSYDGTHDTRTGKRGS
jgi:hypothetical protein